MVRRFLEKDDLAPWVADTFGNDRCLSAVDRLRGGTKKGVYRLHFDRGPSSVLYVWRTDEDFWPRPPGGPLDDAHPFSPASGFALFESAYARLRDLGIRTPSITLAGRGMNDTDADFALVEDLGARTLESVLTDEPLAAQPCLAEVRTSLLVMRNHHYGRIGKVAAICGNATPASVFERCEELVLQRAKVDLDEASERVELLAAVRGSLEAVLELAHDAIVPRQRYSLVHGEFGPDHVLVDPQGLPFLIDIEGLMFFDAEWEHAFLEMRFHDAYEHLRIDRLDEDRLHLYRLAQHLSLVAGPLRLLDGDFEDRSFMRRIVEHNLTRVLSFVPTDRLRTY
jgi:hypothetical protein